MRPLKCYAAAAWCLWNGHKPVPGTTYSVVYGKRVLCVCCARCHAVIQV